MASLWGQGGGYIYVDIFSYTCCSPKEAVLSLFFFMLFTFLHRSKKSVCHFKKSFKTHEKTWLYKSIDTRLNRILWAERLLG